MFFDNWSSLARVLVVGSLAYAALVLILRLSGKRTLTKLNAFDLVVTVALGSTLATVVLSKSVALAEGVVAMVLLVALQAIISWTSVRWPLMRRFVTDEPTLLIHHGRFLERSMRAERMTQDDLMAALRSEGVADISKVVAAVLESDGSISVVQETGAGEAAGTIEAIKRHEPSSTP